MRTPPTWGLGAGPAWAGAAGAVLLVLAALTGRPDVAALGAVGVLATLPRRAAPRDAVQVQVEPVDVGGRGLVAARVDLTAPAGTQAVRLRVDRPGYRSLDALVDVPDARSVPVSTASVRTGRQPLVGVQAQGLADGGHLASRALVLPPTDVVVLPVGRDAGELPLPPRLRGSTGQHRSRRPGDGGDLRDVHPRQPGDPLRRIDWRVTARRAPALDQLYVRRSLALAEATVTLVVDSRDDLGPDPATWNGERAVRPDESTSLDLARQAAATVAEGHLGLGDRVGMEDLGVRRRTLRVGTGRSQLDRLRHQLALLRPEGRPAARVRPPRVQAGSLVYLFSTFLDDEPVELAAAWQGTGHRVVAVDVLPRPRPAADARLRLALRMVQIDRADRLADVRTAGIDVLEWADPSSAARLHALARRSHHAGTRGARS